MFKGGYSNSVFQIDKDLNKKHSFRKEHFDIWIHLE